MKATYNAEAVDDFLAKLEIAEKLNTTRGGFDHRKKGTHQEIGAAYKSANDARIFMLSTKVEPPTFVTRQTLHMNRKITLDISVAEWEILKHAVKGYAAIYNREHGYPNNAAVDLLQKLKDIHP